MSPTPLKRINSVYIYLGFGLLAAFLLLEFLPWKLTWLVQLQRDEGYKRWSGLVLLLYILFQLGLSLTRIGGQWHWAKTLYRIHKKLGVVAPLVFFAHSMTLGYGYTMWLGIVFLSNVLLGLFNREFVGIKNPTYNFFWMVLHVGFSLFIILLTGYHIWVALAYE